MNLGGWKNYLTFLNDSPYAVKLLSSNLAPLIPAPAPQRVRINRLNYKLWPFQQRILEKIGGATLILGLPTGLGKTFVAGAYLKNESIKRPLRVLFLTPSIPLGVQQTLFAKKMLNLEEACFVSGGISPGKRRELKVWNRGFVVTTPQTFANDFLSEYSTSFKIAKVSKDPVSYLEEALLGKFSFPYDVVVADETQRYIGETDGYSILLAAKSSGVNILALSATPQLHASERLGELKKIFDNIRVFSIEDPEIRCHVPPRIVTIIRVQAPEVLLRVYASVGKVIQGYQHRIREIYGSSHVGKYCKEHGLCVGLLALKILKFRLVEDGASSVLRYGTWKIKDLRKSRRDLEGKSVYQLYQEALKKSFNHKILAALGVLKRELYKKAIVYVESVMAAKHMAAMLHKSYDLGDVAVLVGKGNMSTDQQASSLMQFKERAKILVCTSVGEEGLDIPSADIEVWMDPPSNPRKWIQRFGRILRQPGDKKVARIYALVSMRTHEKSKLLSVMRRTEKVYGFTQKLESKVSKPLPRGQESLSQYLGT